MVTRSGNAAHLCDSATGKPLGPPLQNGPEIDTDLARVLDAWPALPAAIRAGILAMIEAARSS